MQNIWERATKAGHVTLSSDVMLGNPKTAAVEAVRELGKVNNI